MKHHKEATIINELTSLAQIITSPIDNEQPRKSFGFDKWNISFVGYETCTKYQDDLEKLFFSNKEISSTYTLKKFENELINLIRVLKNESRTCKGENFTELINTLLKVEIQESEILYNFFGATMREPSIQYGEFTIYDKEKSIDLLVSKYPFLQNKELYSDNLYSKIIIGVKVKARENDKAVEIADKLCETFENVFSYAISDLTHLRRIGILNFRGWTSVNRIVCNNNSMGFNGKNDPFLSVDIDHPFFKNETQGNDLIWNLITKEKNEIEKRLDDNLTI
jgi:hypothetical protein